MSNSDCNLNSDYLQFQYDWNSFHTRFQRIQDWLPIKCILYLLQMWPNFKTVSIKVILLSHLLSEESFPEKLSIAKPQATVYYLGGSEDHCYQEKP